MPLTDPQSTAMQALSQIHETPPRLAWHTDLQIIGRARVVLTQGDFFWEGRNKYHIHGSGTEQGRHTVKK